MQILGGHTEVTAVVNQPVVNVMRCHKGEERKSDLYRRSQGGHGYCRQ